jgi:ribosomal protein L21E
MAKKYKVGQRIGINVQKLINNPHHTPFLSYHGKLGTVTGLHGATDEAAEELQVYEVLLDVRGKVTLVVREDALVAARQLPPLR